MVSHWLIQYEPDIKPVPMPSFVAHFVGHQSEKKPVSKEEYLALFQEFREQIRADSAKIIAEMREDFKNWLKWLAFLPKILQIGALAKQITDLLIHSFISKIYSPVTGQIQKNKTWVFSVKLQ